MPASQGIEAAGGGLCRAISRGNLGRMKNPMLVCAIAIALCGVWAATGQNDATAREILAMERKALDGLQVGDPDPHWRFQPPRSRISTPSRRSAWMACRR